MHLNLKAKFALLTGAMVLAVGGILTTFLTRQQEKTIRDELMTRAVALTEGLAYNCQLPLAAENKPSLGRLAQGMFKQAEVSYVQFLTSDSTEMYLQQDEGMTWPFEVVDSLDVRELEGGTRTAWLSTPAGSTYVDVRVPVVVEGAEDGDILATGRRAENVYLGEVRVGLSTEPAVALIARVRHLGGLLGLVIAVAGAILVAIFVHVLTRPLSQLMEGNRRVARGDFSLRLSVRTGDEFGRLAGSYNQMADEIQRSRELAESYLASLRSNAEHLEEANRALQQSNGELAKASRMKSEFLAVMSHELRTPLNVILGFSEVLLDQTFGALNPKQSRYTENILSSGRHLLVLINDILDLSKVEAGRMKVAPEPFDLKLLINEIQGQVRNLASKKDVEVGSEPVPTLSPVTDPKIFKQVMLNLLSNAIKFTPSGGRVDLAVRCMDGRTLRSDAASRPLPPERRLGITPRQVLLVEVRDTGVGIAAEDYEKIFQAFQQVDASYARRQEGTGLGLALTRKLVRLLGGDIWFVSQVGRGSTFWFFVPYEFNDGEGTATERQMDLPSDTAQDDNESPSTPVVTGEFTPESQVETGDVRVAKAGDWPWGGGPGADAAAATNDAAETGVPDAVLPPPDVFADEPSVPAVESPAVDSPTPTLAPKLAPRSPETVVSGAGTARKGRRGEKPTGPGGGRGVSEDA